MTGQRRHHYGPLAGEAIESRLIFLASFPVFLAVAVAARLVPGRGGAGRRSIVAEARAATNTCIPFAFMG